VPMTVDFSVNQNTSIAGMQFALDLQGLNLATITANKIPVGPDNYFVTKDGILRFSWSTNDAVKIGINEIMFSIVLSSIEPRRLSEKLKLIADNLSPEAYTSDDLEILKVNLDVTNDVASTDGINFFGVDPNPFTSEINIHVILVDGGHAEIRFYDPAGKLIHQMDRNYLPGKHIEHLMADKLFTGQGIIYCQLISNGFTSMQKILKL